VKRFYKEGDSNPAAAFEMRHAADLVPAAAVGVAGEGDWGCCECTEKQVLGSASLIVSARIFPCGACGMAAVRG